MDECNCYVKRLDRETRFCLRYGAHSSRCPVYRPSLDPVDRQHDQELRAEMVGRLLAKAIFDS